jgi:large subunit ribosomal protein L29
MAVKIRMKGIRGMNEKDLRDRIEQTRTELMKLRVESSKGTLRKESGKLKPLRKNVARLLTRLNEVKNND